MHISDEEKAWRNARHRVLKYLDAVGYPPLEAISLCHQVFRIVLKNKEISQPNSDKTCHDPTYSAMIVLWCLLEAQPVGTHNILNPPKNQFLELCPTPAIKRATMIADNPFKSIRSSSKHPPTPLYLGGIFRPFRLILLIISIVFIFLIL
jgi:hypothetical protein